MPPRGDERRARGLPEVSGGDDRSASLPVNSTQEACQPAGRFSTPRTLPATIATSEAAKENSAPILAASCTGPGGKATPATKSATVKPIAATQPTTKRSRSVHPRRQAEPEGAGGEEAEQADAERLADEEPDHDQPGRGADRRELDPGVGEAEEEEHDLDRRLQPVLHPVEQVGQALLLRGEEAELDVGMRDRRNDRQQAERGMDARHLERRTSSRAPATA